MCILPNSGRLSLCSTLSDKIFSLSYSHSLRNKSLHTQLPYPALETKSFSFEMEWGIQSDCFYEMQPCDELFPDAEMDEASVSPLKYLCKQVDFNQMALSSTCSTIVLDIVKTWIKTFLLTSQNLHTSSKKKREREKKPFTKHRLCVRIVIRHKLSIYGVGIHSENIYDTLTFDGYWAKQRRCMTLVNATS